MNKIIWIDEYSVNNARMDYQHKKIIRMINELIEHQQAGEDSEFISNKLSQMTEYCLNHLADEEEMLMESGFPDFASHQALHDEFRNKVVQICTATSLGIDVMPVMLGYLSEWWSHHICVDDMQYRDTL